MTISIVSTILTNTVVTGVGNYSSVLTISNGAGIEISTQANDITRALYVPSGQSPSSVVTFGTIFSNTQDLTSGGGVGVWLEGTTSLQNFFGTISGTYLGVFAQNGAIIYNSGTIEGGAAALAVNNSSVENNGYLTSNNDGILLVSSSLNNIGTISGSSIGVSAPHNTSIFNLGTISSNSVALYLPAGGTVVQAGLLSGKYAVVSEGTLDLTLTQFSTLDGIVTDLSGNGTISLEGTAENVLNLASLEGFSEVIFLPGSHWNIEEKVDSLASGQKIYGFSSGDTIVVDGFQATSKSYSSAQGLILSNSIGSETIDINGTYSSDEFIISNPTNLVTDIVAPCFLKGTLIETRKGLIPVEKISIGDCVRTLAGRYKTVKWVGKRSYNEAELQSNEGLQPVEFLVGSISNGVPSRNLFVSQDHGIFLGGFLIRAEHLVNNINIFQLSFKRSVEYFHIEFDSHEIILAESCPVESFWDFDCRTRFENALDYEKLYGGEAVPDESRLPRCDRGFNLWLTKELIRRRSGHQHGFPTFGPMRGFVDEISPECVRGWVQDIDYPETPVVLEIVSKSETLGTVIANEFRKDLKNAKLGFGCHGFSFQPKNKKLTAEIIVRRQCDGTVLNLSSNA